MKITLKDGNTISIDSGSTVLDLAQAISSGLSRVAIAGIVDGVAVDLAHQLTGDCVVQILTCKDSTGIEILRHSAAHLLSNAVKNLYPNAQLAIGSPTQSGFYYDIDFGTKIVQDDLIVIEQEMQRIANANCSIIRQTVSRKEALDIFQGEEYKVSIIADIPKDETIAIYKQGDFVELCSGPHVPYTGHIKNFRLTQITGAYFRGDNSNKMLTRVYGVVFEKKSELTAYLAELEEAKKRDHSKLGRELNIYITNESVGQGLPLFAPKGARILQRLIRWVEDEEEKRGYQLTRTPNVAKADLYKISGHWDNYRQSMFVLGQEDSYMAMRPMSCPFQFMVYKSQLRSYRDLPIRLSETATLMRNEDSGEMHGLIRLRQFTLSDGHIVCMPEQVENEFAKCIDFVNYLLNTLGLTDDIKYRFSRHDPSNMSKYIDNPSMWHNAESTMKSILDNLCIEYSESIGDAAFYGPKLDLQISNVYGKEDTLITVQIDFVLADMFDMEYIDSGGTKKRPIIIHRSSIGCYERTLALLIEKYNGAFPTWLSPTQVVVMSLTDRTAQDADNIVQQLLLQGISAVSDNRSQKIGYKIREAQLEKIPYMIIIGDKDKQSNSVSVRSRANGDIGAMTLNDFVCSIKKEIDTKSNKQLLRERGSG